jgi:lysophospholipase
MKLFLLVAIFFSSFAQAIEEDQSYDAIVDFLVSGKTCSDDDSQAFWQLKTIPTPKRAFQNGRKYQLRYSKYGCTLGSKGALVISPGRTEASPEYYETAIDFIQRGYSPVYVIDHRGQGMSPRLLPDPSKGHVEEFEDYISDLNTATKAFIEDLETLGFDQSRDHLFFTSNSMGSAIGIGYFGIIGDNSPYSAAAILGSQIRINYLSFINKPPTRLNNAIYNEAGVIAQASFACNVQNKCDDYARSEVFGPYVPGSRQFTYEDDIKDQEKLMTHSENRYNLKTYLWDDHDWSFLDYQDENWISPALGGATFRWTYTATKFVRKMRSTRFIKDLPDRPLLILTGTNDLRAYKPYIDGSTDLSWHSDYCQKINEKNRHRKKLCTFMPLKGSFHEIYKESDQYRNQALEIVDNFFTKAKK